MTDCRRVRPGILSRKSLLAHRHVSGAARNARQCAAPDCRVVGALRNAYPSEEIGYGCLSENVGAADVLYEDEVIGCHRSLFGLAPNGPRTFGGSEGGGVNDVVQVGMVNRLT